MQQHPELFNGDDWSFCAQSQYESAIIDEARSIVRGASIKPTLEHLRVLVSWLDSSVESPQVDDSQQELPF
jgi:hypothetical protein